MPAKIGDTVRVHYTGTLAEGEVFDSSRDGEPLEFMIGAEMMIPGFEKAVIGHEKGDRFTAVIAPEDAYGAYQDDMLIEVSSEEIPDDIEIEEGKMLELETDEGTIEVEVLRVTDNAVVLDANHPLAGEELTFDIEIVDIQEGDGTVPAQVHSHCGCGCEDGHGNDSCCGGSGGCCCH